MKLRQLPLILLSAFTLSACNNLEMPNSLGLTPGIAPSSLGGGLQGSSQDGTQTTSAHSPADYTLSNINTTKGNHIANHAKNNASGGTGWCYAHVAKSIHTVYDPFLWGEHAYMAADQLASNKNFKEVSTSALHALPAGAVVVWEQGTSPSGHISIATGKGFEVSDHIAPQMQSHYGGGQPRVFLPQ